MPLRSAVRSGAVCTFSKSTGCRSAQAQTSALSESHNPRGSCSTSEVLAKIPACGIENPEPSVRERAGAPAKARCRARIRPSSPCSARAAFQRVAPASDLAHAQYAEPVTSLPARCGTKLHATLPCKICGKQLDRRHRVQIPPPKLMPHLFTSLQNGLIFQFPAPTSLELLQDLCHARKHLGPRRNQVGLVTYPPTQARLLAPTPAPTAQQCLTKTSKRLETKLMPFCYKLPWTANKAAIKAKKSGS